MALSIAFADSKVNIVQHGELQGLKFYKIGDLKLVTKFLEIEITKNLTTLENALLEMADILHDFIKEAKENHTVYLEEHPQDTKQIEELKQHWRELEGLEKLKDLKRYEFDDLTRGVDSSQLGKTRKRRWIPDPKKDLEIFRNRINELTYQVQNYQTKLGEFAGENKASFEEINRKVQLEVLHTKIVRIEKSLEAIIVMQIQNRLNTHLVSYDEFRGLLKYQEEFLTEDEELPYGYQINKYFSNLEIRQEIFENVSLSVMSL